MNGDCEFGCCHYTHQKLHDRLWRIYDKWVTELQIIVVKVGPNQASPPPGFPTPTPPFTWSCSAIILDTIKTDAEAKERGYKDVYHALDKASKELEKAADDVRGEIEQEYTRLAIPDARERAVLDVPYGCVKPWTRFLTPSTP